MRHEAAAAGYWHSELYETDFPRVQILTAREIIEQGRKPDLPRLVGAPYQRAERAPTAGANAMDLWPSQTRP